MKIHVRFFSLAALLLWAVQPALGQDGQATATMRVTATVVHSCQIATDAGSVGLSCANAKRVRPRVTAEDLDGPLTISEGHEGRFHVLADASEPEAPAQGPSVSDRTVRTIRVTVSF